MHVTLLVHYQLSYSTDLEYSVSVISYPPGSFINGSDNSFGYPVGSDVNLTCLMTPTPPTPPSRGDSLLEVI